MPVPKKLTLPSTGRTDRPFLIRAEKKPVIRGIDVRAGSVYSAGRVSQIRQR